jgi:hypothetical protein
MLAEHPTHMRASSLKRKYSSQASPPIAWLLRYLEVASSSYVITKRRTQSPISQPADDTKLKYIIDRYAGVNST